MAATRGLATRTSTTGRTTPTTISPRGAAVTTHFRLGGGHGRAGSLPAGGCARMGGQPGHPASANTLQGPAERGVAATPSKPAAGGAVMARKHRNLIDAITADANMVAAYRRTARGRRLTAGHLEFKEFSALNLECLADEMRRGAYRPGEPRTFEIYDPKHRTISALPFRDRVAQHALCAVIEPIFDAGLLPRSYACRKGKGTHAGAVAVQAELRRLARGDTPIYVLKTDFSRYFASIEHGTLWRMIEAKISCRATLRLIEAIVPRSGIGLPIGSLVSQIFANVYAGALDRHLQQDLGERHWHRYMDDLVVLGPSIEHLRRLRVEIEAFSRDRLGLRFSKWSVQPVSRGVNFLGYRIWPTHKLLRRDSVQRARRKIKAFRAAGDHRRLALFLASWTGHASWADSHNLLRSLEIAERPAHDEEYRP